MTTGYLLIVAVLVLGGVIATVGDRIGMRVGKARLSLFNLRPKQTATVISVLTGSVVSGTTLGLLFIISDQLRTGVFQLENLQSDLNTTRSELTQAQQDQADVEQALAESTQAQAQAKQRLTQINRSLKTAIDREAETQSQLQQTQSQLQGVSNQAQELRSEISSLQQERQTLLSQQASVRAQIQQRDAEIAQRDTEIAQKEERLAGLQDQQIFLEQEILRLEREFIGLRQGSLALSRNEPILAGLVRVDDMNQAQRLVEQLLQRANRVALERISAGIDQFDRRVIQISDSEVNRLINQIRDGDEYLVRLLPAANYVVGEPCVVRDRTACIQVFFEVFENRLIYEPGELLATTRVTAINPSAPAIFEQINLLLASSQFRAVQDGVVGDVVQIANGEVVPVSQFINRIRTYGQPLTLQAVASEPIFTTGPLRVDLLALSQGEVVFSTVQVSQLDVSPTLNFPPATDRPPEAESIDIQPFQPD
ncbi:MAG: DUF3084 domain-containing protein [Cyanobacteria bacterium J06639_16]